MKIRFLVHGALIAAVYTIITYAVAPITSGLIQCRISEALCVLPFFTPAAIPGLFIGCLLSNFLMGSVIYDVVFGSLATLIAAVLTWYIRKRLPEKTGLFLAPLPAVVVNAIIVGYLLAFVYEVGAPFVLCALYVGIGQAIACYALGLPLMLVLKKYPIFE